MVTATGAQSAGSARQPDDSGSRWKIGVGAAVEVARSQRCRTDGSASSEKLRKLDVLPSNKPLQRMKAASSRSTIAVGNTRVHERSAVQPAVEPDEAGGDHLGT